jgi:hypothetical protein
MEFSHQYAAFGAAETDTVAKRDADVMGAGPKLVELHGACALPLLQELAGVTRQMSGLARKQYTLVHSRSQLLPRANAQRRL